jgi:hypothetical protein
MADERQWYPADWVDESCPLHKASPDGFIVAEADGSYCLGYAADDKDVLADDRENLNRPLAIGDVVDFMCCDRLDNVEADFFRSGELIPHGAIPPEHNNVTIGGDIDTLHESFDDLVAALSDPREDLHDYVDCLFEDDGDLTTVTLCFARWSDPLPHQFLIDDGKPVFQQVPAPKALN